MDAIAIGQQVACALGAMFLFELHEITRRFSVRTGLAGINVSSVKYVNTPRLSRFKCIYTHILPYRANVSRTSYSDNSVSTYTTR